MLEHNFTQLRQLTIDNRLPHSILLLGEQGMLNSVKLWLQWLLCDAYLEQQYGCNECSHCKLFIANNHPNYYAIDLGSTTEIKIDLIRAANDFVVTKPFSNKYKILLINNLHKLKIQAANAFLKTLEEPGEMNLILGITDSVELIPITILSRMVKLSLHNLNKTLVGSAEVALCKQQIVQDLYDLLVVHKINIVQIVAKWLKITKDHLIMSLWLVVTDLLKPTNIVLLQEIQQKIPSKVVWLWLDSLNYINKMMTLGGQINLGLFLYNFILTQFTIENIYAARINE